MRDRATFLKQALGVLGFLGLLGTSPLGASLSDENEYATFMEPSFQPQTEDLLPDLKISEPLGKGFLSPSPCLLLSIDGGGIRGLLPALVLDWLEEEIAKQIIHHHPRAPQVEVRIGECFDWVAGTSTGGLITLGLGVPHLETGRPLFKAQTFVNLYKEQGTTIFPQQKGLLKSFSNLMSSKFDPKPLEELFQSYYEERTLKDLLKPTLITAYDIHGETLFVFNSQKARQSDKENYKLKDVARATSAAPTYLPAITLEDESLSPTSHTLVDGGVSVNNPTLLLYLEAISAAPTSKFHVISLGCGQAPLFSLESKKSGGLLHWASDIPSVLMNGSSQGVHQNVSQLASIRGDLYTRLQFSLDKKVSHLDDSSPQNIQNLEGYFKRERQNPHSSLHTLKKAVIEFYKSRWFYVHFPLIETLASDLSQDPFHLSLQNQTLGEQALWEVRDYLQKSATRVSIKSLDLSGSQIETSDLFPFLSSLDSLTFLVVKNFHLSLSDFKKLTSVTCFSLESLDVRGNPLLESLPANDWVLLFKQYRTLQVDDAICYKMGQYWEKMMALPKALEFYTAGSDPSCQLAAAQLLRHPTCQEEGGFLKAIQIYEDLSRTSHQGEAPYLLGYIYWKGTREECEVLKQTDRLKEGTQREKRQKASEWFKKAAERGHKRAAIQLGVFYENSLIKAERPKGEKQDGSHQLKKALYYYKLAAKAGSRSAQKDIQRIKEQLRSIDIRF